MLKYIGFITMAIDHIGFMYFPDMYILRFIGRISYPIFALYIALGFSRTPKRELYLAKLSLFSIISQIPFSLFYYLKEGTWAHFNIGFTLLAGLLCLYIYEKVNRKIGVTLIMAIVLLSQIFHFDYQAYGVLLIIILYKYMVKTDNILYVLLLLLIVYAIPVACKKYELINQFWCFLFIPIMRLIYMNKELVYTKKRHKYFEYLFYPVHLLCLTASKLLFTLYS